ncbi:MULTISPECIES: KGG domain-containing protein [unclassified Massilia]|uniref:KGG domain-containing protein n=1 Tax=unclassified Massilia TaxID=2609279 RepID=UPI00177E0D27|nr:MULTISPECIES: KGG domain-containing protein [unclassified Massilia]MBD8533054.1 stress-induced protein [Massilia sp. CFBP 13647]MBD8676414.1 stress-induced protein [Massilia sp. CFBP 13721]
MAANNQGGNQGNNQGDNQGSKQGSKQSGNTSNRGFASMDPQRQREIASEGGRAAHASGNAHEFTSEEARRAGSMSHKNDGNKQSGSGGNGSARGGTPEQHAKAGSQSRKNDA